MNLILLAAVMFALFVTLWLVQFFAVRWAGEGRVWTLPFRHGSDHPKVRGPMKAVLALGVLAIVVAYPPLIGDNPWNYHLAKTDFRLLGLSAQTFALVFTALAILFLASVALGLIRLEYRHGVGTLAIKIAKGFWIPFPLTLMEEPLFRGIVLEQLLAAGLGVGPSLIFSAFLFAAVHFLRPQKHGFLAALALFYVGLILGAAYLMSGHNYLLPIAIHAAGVLFIQVTRPVSYYLGPAWLIGRSSYPIGGLLGMAAVAGALALVSIQMPT